MPAKYHPAPEEMSLAGVMHALSDPVRLKLVLVLQQGGDELGCKALQAEVPVVKSTLSHHIRTLREAGIARVRTQGTQSFISLRLEELEGRFPGIMPAVIQAAAEQGSTLPGPRDSDGQ